MPDETWRPQPDDDLVAKLRRGWWLYESGEIRDMQNEAADEIERLRKALTDIVENDSRGRGCSTYTKGSCREDPGRTLLSGYGATSWCDSCIAMDALTSPETPPQAPESAPEKWGRVTPPTKAMLEWGAANISPGSETECSWHGAMDQCVEPPAGRWALVDPPPYFGENVGPKIRWWCAIHGAELEKVGWHKLASPETPPSSPESAPEAQSAPMGPEDKLVDLMAELERSVNDAKANRKRKP